MSDYEVEDRLNDSISFSRFVGISLEDSLPDHSVLSRFRSELNEKEVYGNHHVTDQEGLVLGVLTALANINEISKVNKS